MIQFPCSSCGYQLSAADGTSTAALLVCDRCGNQVSIPAAQSAAAAAVAEEEPFRNFGSPSAADGDLPPPAADDDEVPLSKFELPDPLPPELKALGDPVRNCPTKSKAPMWLIGGGILAAAIGSFMLLAFITKGNAPPARGARASANVPCFSFLLLPGGLVAIALGWAIDWQARIVVFRKGFAHFKRGKLTVYPYDDIVGVWQSVTKHYYNGVYTGTTYVYRVRGQGNEISITNVYPTVQWLGERIQNEVGNRAF